MNTISAWHARTGRDGFTLVEVLAALAIGSVIIFSTAALISNVALSFDRGTRGVSKGERIILITERLTSDFSSVRFLVQPSATGARSIFFTGTSSNVAFVTGGGIGAGPQGEEVVTLTVEDQKSNSARLVRRQAPWLGPHARLDSAALQDDVVLIEGNFDMAFAFGRSQPGQVFGWSDQWTGESTIPRVVRLTLRDRARGVDLLRGTQFLIRSDAPQKCAGADAQLSCLSFTASDQKSSPPPAGNPK
jgi:prepilin-type N-terminal cleavage/methylation domain-containing protein